MSETNETPVEATASAAPVSTEAPAASAAPAPAAAPAYTPSERPQRSYGDRPERPSYGDRSSSGPGGARRKPAGKYRRGRRKVCTFCVQKLTAVDYKSIPVVRKFMTDRCKIVPRRTSGTCAKHQRMLAMAIKRARHMGFVGYIAE